MTNEEKTAIDLGYAWSSLKELMVNRGLTHTQIRRQIMNHALFVLLSEEQIHAGIENKEAFREAAKKAISEEVDALFASIRA